jgi:hypothetical protein
MDTMTCSPQAIDLSKSYPVPRIPARASETDPKKTAHYPATAEQWNELGACFWRAAKFFRKNQQRNVAGELMWPRLVDCTKQCAEQAKLLAHRANVT